MKIKNILFMATNDWESHTCGECALFNTSDCDQSGSGVRQFKEDRACDEFVGVKKEGGKVTITVTVDDLFNMVNVEPCLINPAGGFTKTFAYEGVWTLNKGGQRIWTIIWDNGEKRGLEIVGQDKKWLPKVQINGTYYKIVNPPLLDYNTSWTLKNMLEYNETSATAEPSKVFDDVYGIIKYFVDLDYSTESTEGKYVAAACWVIGTYFYELFPMYPYLLAVGYRGSGKTQLVASSIYQSYHGTEPSALPTISALFREIETCKPSVFLDNAEQYYEHASMSDENRSIIQMLDIGAYRGGSVPRVEGDSKKRYIEKYCVYSPKGITTIMGVTASLESRSISFSMVKTDKKEYGDRFPELKIMPRNPNDLKAVQIQVNRNNLYALRMKMWQKVMEVYEGIHSSQYGVINRDWDVWHPIFTVAEIFCPDRIPEIKKFVKELVGLSKDSMMDEEKEGAVAALAMLWTGSEEWVPIQKFADTLTAYKQIDNPKFSATGKQAGNMLRSLGFIERKRDKNKRLFLLNANLLKKHAKDLDIKLNDGTVNAGKGHQNNVESNQNSEKNLVLERFQQKL